MPADQGESRPAPVQARSERTLARVLQAAHDVLVQDGVTGFAIVPVAQRAQVAVGSIYRYFRGRDDLLQAVALRAVDTIETAVTDALAGELASLTDVFVAYSQALAAAYRDMANAVVSLLTIRDARVETRSTQAMHTMRTLLADRATSHLTAPTAEQQAAIDLAGEAILGGCFLRAAKGVDIDDPQAWDDWAVQAAAMAVTHVEALQPTRPDPLPSPSP